MMIMMITVDNLRSTDTTLTVAWQSSTYWMFLFTSHWWSPALPSIPHVDLVAFLLAVSYRSLIALILGADWRKHQGESRSGKYSHIWWFIRRPSVAMEHQFLDSSAQDWKVRKAAPWSKTPWHGEAWRVQSISWFSNRFMGYATGYKQIHEIYDFESWAAKFYDHGFNDGSTSTEITPNQKGILFERFCFFLPSWVFHVGETFNVNSCKYLQFINLYLFKRIFEKKCWETKTTKLHQVCNKEKDPGDRSSDCWQAARFSTWPFWALCPAEISWKPGFVTVLNPCFLEQ